MYCIHDDGQLGLDVPGPRYGVLVAFAPTIYRSVLASSIAVSGKTIFCSSVGLHGFLKYRALSQLHIIHHFGKSYEAVPSIDRCARA
jgi:hypothetical protein